MRNSAVGMEMLKRRVRESMLRSSMDGGFTIKHYFERGFHYKTIVNFEKFPDSKFPLALNSRLKISRDNDITKLGSFYFGVIHLCVNGKINPVLKRPYVPD